MYLLKIVCNVRHCMDSLPVAVTKSCSSNISEPRLDWPVSMAPHGKLLVSWYSNNTSQPIRLSVMPDSLAASLLHQSRLITPTTKTQSLDLHMPFFPHLGGILRKNPLSEFPRKLFTTPLTVNNLRNKNSKLGSTQHFSLT